MPLLVAALATLEICALTGFKLNYANIIAFSVLLGVGVAFKIYYIMARRRDETDFLQSALTRAVFFSALLTGTAFGSLWISSNPGMSRWANCWRYPSPALSRRLCCFSQRSWARHAPKTSRRRPEFGTKWARQRGGLAFRHDKDTAPTSITPASPLPRIAGPRAAL